MLHKNNTKQKKERKGFLKFIQKKIKAYPMWSKLAYLK
jgi:hypothetical protein